MNSPRAARGPVDARQIRHNIYHRLRWQNPYLSRLLVVFIAATVLIRYPR